MFKKPFRVNNNMKPISKDSLLITMSIVILFLTALIDWNIYSWLILLGIILVLFGWYIRKQK